ncbi:MAG: GlsB/YeaQ/YmgE family stress response membrane protein [Acidimicrobiales bacterium]
MIIAVLLLLFVALFVALPLIGLAVGAVLSAVLVGLVVGALGRLVIPGRQSIGLLATALLGLIGSIVGSFVGYHLLGIGALSILLEIGIAAAAVAIYSRRPGRRRHLGTGTAGRLP